MEDNSLMSENKSNFIVSEEDLILINKLTRRKFEKEEVYVFSVVLCDNNIDRHNEKFTDKSLEKLAKLYIGKTGILDHNPKSENQTARIFKCYVESINDKLNTIGEPYKRVIAKAYMPKCSKNENIILEIDSGIKKEVSVGCSVEKTICSICNRELSSDYCSHIKGRSYKQGNDLKLCFAILENPTDAYEWSFVAVPAQREAGVIKSKSILSKGGEGKIEDIIKNLSFENLKKITEPEMNKIYESIKSLKEKAKIGDFYKEELKLEVINLSSMVQPELEKSVIKSICDKISLDELKSLKVLFKNQFSKMVPLKPQISSDETEISKTENLQFKI